MQLPFACKRTQELRMGAKVTECTCGARRLREWHWVQGCNLEWHWAHRCNLEWHWVHTCKPWWYAACRLLATHHTNAQTARRNKTWLNQHQGKEGQASMMVPIQIANLTFHSKRLNWASFRGRLLQMHTWHTASDAHLRHSNWPPGQQRHTQRHRQKERRRSRQKQKRRRSRHREAWRRRRWC